MRAKLEGLKDERAFFFHVAFESALKFERTCCRGRPCQQLSTGLVCPVAGARATPPSFHGDFYRQGRRRGRAKGCRLPAGLLRPVDLHEVDTIIT
jgi:hypothetical protein